MVAFGNPVKQAVIRPSGSPLIVGDFRVSCSFACHAARVPVTTLGCDVGNGLCGEPLLAMTTGRVSMATTFPDGSKVIRIVCDAAPDHEPAVAHCATIEVVKDQHVVEGQRIGTLGKTGTSVCHAHLGLKVKGVETDIWGYLRQNQEAWMPGYKIGTNIGTFQMVGVHALISPIDPKNGRYLQQPDAGPWDVASSLDLKTPEGKPVDIDGNSPPKDSRDQVFLVDAPGFGIAAWALRQDGTFTPKGCHSDEDLQEAAKRARANGIADAAVAAGAVK